MYVLNEQELAAKLDFQSPLVEEPDRPDSLWCIPFEYGSQRKGTRISIAKAKEIAAELRAAVAEAEKRALFREFHRERGRGDAALKEAADYQNQTFILQREVADLKQRLRAKRR